MLLLAEDAPDGELFGAAEATDADGDVLVSSITAGNGDGVFAINSSTGQITVADTPFERQNLAKLIPLGRRAEQQKSQLPDPLQFADWEFRERETESNGHERR